MKLQTKVVLGLCATLLAVNVASAGDLYAKKSQHTHSKGCDSMNMLPSEMGVDVVARATKHLSELKAKLNLSQEQQPAWQKFSEQINEQARSMAAMQNKMNDKAKNIPMPLPMSVPEQMVKMAETMKDRAQDMAKMADTVKYFYAVLSPQQQAIFDKMHMNQMSAMNRKGQGDHMALAQPMKYQAKQYASEAPMQTVSYIR